MRILGYFSQSNKQRIIYTIYKSDCDKLIHTNYDCMVVEIRTYCFNNSFI